ncbi:pyruvate kinase alpha/beta domain-containing protein [Methanothermobacter sp.]|uniref:pyruvate kinase alpha/beta domain-containing protein n=1 Tax=Methanothermobacter sp. TaxID=1884223 RepID=UPI00260A6900|nr:pyruvate kinase alpha/beta domain-containing protein [Methanothermobacter sp.]MDI9618064.1 pyruvate kinase alpha/beta domain-containing protein [Methanothermobacter sp.]
MMESICYFESPGKENTERVLELVKERADKLGIRDFVVASVSGETALRLSEMVEGNIVSVTHHAGFREKGKLELEPGMKEKLIERGVSVYAGSHALSGVGRGISNKFGGVTPVEVMAETLRMVSQGFKVCVEISIMAADAGLIPVDREVIAIGGTAWGADTAMVITPAHMNSVFDLRIHEIIAMPRP